MLLEIGDLLLDAGLLLLQEGVGGTVLLQGLVLHVGGHVDVTLVVVGGEEVVHRHFGSVVEVTGHHILSTKVGLDIIVLHPEEGELLHVLVLHRLFFFVFTHVTSDGELIGCTVHHRTECHDAAMISGGVLVVVGTLLHKVAEHVGRRDVGLIHLDAVAIDQVGNFLTVEHVLEVEAVALVEMLQTIQLILVGGNLTSIEQLEEEGKEVHAVALWLHGIVEGSVLVLGQVDGTVDVASPSGVFGHIHSGGEHQACAAGSCGCCVGVFGGSGGSGILHTTFLWLGNHRARHTNCH